SQRGQAHYQLARSCYQQDQAAKALEHLESAGTIDPESMNNVSALQFKARIHEKLGQTKEAAEVYRQSLKIDPDASDSLASLVRLALAANDRETALLHLRRYTVVAGSDGDGLVAAADFHLRLGRLDDASDLAHRALRLGANPNAERVIGLIHFARGEY